jgi:hypothetical protein
MIDKPAADYGDADLVDLALQVYARSMAYPNSEPMHNRWVECRKEMIERFAKLRETDSYAEDMARVALEAAQIIFGIAGRLSEDGFSLTGDNLRTEASRLIAAANAKRGHEIGTNQLLEAIERFPEINPSNYGPDEVDAINAWGIKVVTLARECHSQGIRFPGLRTCAACGAHSAPVEGEAFDGCPMCGGEFVPCQSQEHPMRKF